MTPGSAVSSIDDVNERFDLKIEDPYYNTIGGYVFGSSAADRKSATRSRSNGHVLRVEALDGLRIDRLHLIPAKREEDDISQEPIIET